MLHYTVTADYFFFRPTTFWNYSNHFKKTFMQNYVSIKASSIATTQNTNKIASAYFGCMYFSSASFVYRCTSNV